MNDIERIDNFVSDLSVFADLGTDAPAIVVIGDQTSIRFHRLGDACEIIISSNEESIYEILGENKKKHASFSALISSERYGDIGGFARQQQAFYASVASLTGGGIEFGGTLDNDVSLRGVGHVDEFLGTISKPDNATLLLVDGPAGIGKTQFISTLAKQRAERYLQDRKPLIMHVQSRGRALSYIVDLVAFSLQRMRIEITYDQIPILVKHGLVILAIDGFDELADPEGYNLAWGQISDLIISIRGKGRLILAGRETFIGRDRIINEIAAVRVGQDRIAVFTLQPPSKSQALAWLATKGWNESQRDKIAPFLEPSSLALRPFFLATLADEQVAERFYETTGLEVLGILVDALIEREAGLFGENVQREMSKKELEAYVRNLMIEVARDMADNNSVAISDATLSFLVEVALPKPVSDSARRALQARSQVIAFLTNDDRARFKRFSHEKLQEYFFSMALVQMVSIPEKGKPLARNIFGVSLLETFGDFVFNSVSDGEVKALVLGAKSLLDNNFGGDRTARNVGALLLASLPVLSEVGEIVRLEAIQIDDARCVGTSSHVVIDKVIISQLDCRGADLTDAEFHDCTVHTMVADKDTVVSSSLPRPTRIIDVEKRVAAITDPIEIGTWMDSHLRFPPVVVKSLVPQDLRDSEAVRLLQKVCRSRQYWLRRDDDKFALKVLDHPSWPLVERCLEENGLLTVEFRQASGRDARFVHIRQGSDILEENAEALHIVKFYSDFVSKLRK